MDAIQHATHGYLFAKAVEIALGGDVLPLPIEIGSALVGALPDLVGAYGTLILKDGWRLYNQAHNIATGSIANILYALPPYALHLVLDDLTHGNGKRWWIWNERLWAEGLGWVVTLIAWWLLVH